MNIIQAKHLDVNTREIYTYEVPKKLEFRKGQLLLVENKRLGQPSIVIAVTDSEEVSENVLNMIMHGEKVQSKVLATYIKAPIGW